MWLFQVTFKYDIYLALSNVTEKNNKHFKWIQGNETTNYNPHGMGIYS